MTDGWLRPMMVGKIHRATVTAAELDYVGSVTLDADLLEGAGLLPGQQVDIVDVTNGARLTTYAIAGDPGSGVVCINGAAAHLVPPGEARPQADRSRAWLDGLRGRRRRRVRDRRADRGPRAALPGAAGAADHQERAGLRLDDLGAGRHRRRARPGRHPTGAPRGHPGGRCGRVRPEGRRGPGQRGARAGP